MTGSSFYEEGSRLLTPGAFEFVLDSDADFTAMGTFGRTNRLFDRG